MKLGKQCSSGSYWNSVFYDLNDFSYTDSKVGQLIGHCLRLFILNHKEKKCYWSFTGLILSTVDSSQDWLNGQKKKEACVFIQWWNFHKTVKCTNIKCVSKWQARGYFAPEQDWRKHGIYYIQVFFSMSLHKSFKCRQFSSIPLSPVLFLGLPGYLMP